MIDWFMLSMGLAGLVLSALAYIIAMSSNNPKSRKVFKISCAVTSVFSIMLIVFALLD